MDHSWMNCKPLSDEYEEGVDKFIKFAFEKLPDNNGRFYCPCMKCFNVSKLHFELIKSHLICHGVNQSYTKWIWHGELVTEPIASNTNVVDVDMNDRLDDMIRDIGPESFQRAHMYDNLHKDREETLYPGCTNFTRLSAVLRLFNLKARNGWTDKRFTELLELLKEMLPEGNPLPNRNYEAKKILCPMGMECGLSRYKVKGNDSNCDEGIQQPPAKVLWYLPIMPRLKRLFNNVDDAKNIRWHADERKCDGYIRHPADSLQWKKIDALYPEFGNEPRNLRLGLATDGMNPYGNLSSIHSSWPVLLIIYNLPPSICMKRKYIMLSVMISGPKQPGNDIDVYLGPLIEDLRMLWEEGVRVFDAHSRDYFTLRAMLFCTINDFPAYGNLCGYSVKGHLACPICEKDTKFQQLRNGKKTVYLRHRRFLRRNHLYRRLKKVFNGDPENEIAPKALTGEQVYDKVKDVSVIFGKGQKQTAEKNIWKKRSVFFNLSLMHVEKNVCDSVTGKLLNIKGKTKDGVNARLDMVEFRMREELAPHEEVVPQGYSSNFKSLVSSNDLKLVGLKSHDCHILMQQLLPIAIRDILPKKVRDVLTRLSLFFNAICSKVIDPNKLDELENEAAIILCQLEMYFPPSFFDIMVHLIVHLVREIRLCGPLFLRWMYPVERYMKILKGYVKNLRHPEASIVERYVAEEAIEFCSDYMSEAETIGIPKSRNEGRYAGKGRRGLKLKSMGRADVLQAQLYILNNTDEVQPYLSAHKAIVKGKNCRMSEKWLMKEHNKTLLKWFKETILNDNSASDTLKWLSREPNFDVITWSGYDINNFSFSTKNQDDKSTVQNSGVMVIVEAMHFSSSKDKNPVMASIPYFGIIEEIWEVDFMKFKVDMDDPSAPSSSGTSTEPTKKRGRCGTRMKELQLSNDKKPIEFDPNIKLPIGDHVDVAVKNQIWDDIMIKWDIRDTDIGKLKDK
ncbi:hypothetical protein TSUD_281710 [Trifolium subterraneum]|uniref:Transposase-associated domain-containing protein n=1 Tax=Trifolium subterraneum TaxID=3900 RepID=A0A2Z6LWA5_TRISU|nr:hypothetical protein TSUD_281710 [Trifolium subterraneum]